MIFYEPHSLYQFLRHMIGYDSNPFQTTTRRLSKQFKIVIGDTVFEKCHPLLFKPKTQQGLKRFQ